MLKHVSLLTKVITLQLPPRILLYALSNKFHRCLKTGNRRFEFERRYLEYPDPWHYHTSVYENRKYKRTLDSALVLRRSFGSALELGCGPGVFTKMLARHFAAITAVDVSKEAIRAAAAYNKSETNVTYVRGDITTLKFGARFDVIFCSEVLYYILEKYADRVRSNFSRILSSNGIIVMVTLQNKPERTFFYFDAWEDALSPDFKVISKELVQDPIRPYEIAVFSRPEDAVAEL